MQKQLELSGFFNNNFGRQCQVEYQSYKISKLQTNTATINQINFRNIKVSHCVSKNATFLNVI